jgi:hypothetical protein
MQAPLPYGTEAIAIAPPIQRALSFMVNVRIARQAANIQGMN